MKVTGTKTTTQDVVIDLSDKEMERVVESFDVNTLLHIVRDKMMSTFVKSLAGKPGDFFIAKRHWSKNQRLCPEKGEGSYLTLIELDAGFDYHNNVGVDETVRVLTDEEVERFNAIDNLPSRTLELYLTK